MDGTVSPLLRRLRDRWGQLGIANDALPAVPELDAFEARHAVRMPPIVRSYFLRLNGTRQGRLMGEDPEELSFWHLNQIKSVEEEMKWFDEHAPSPGGSPWALPARGSAFERTTFFFADYSIWAFGLGVQLCEDPNAAAPVYIFFDMPQADLIADSFEKFIEIYLSGRLWSSSL